MFRKTDTFLLIYDRTHDRNLCNILAFGCHQEINAAILMTKTRQLLARELMMTIYRNIVIVAKSVDTASECRIFRKNSGKVPCGLLVSER